MNLFVVFQFVVVIHFCNLLYLNLIIVFQFVVVIHFCNLSCLNLFVVFQFDLIWFISYTDLTPTWGRPMREDYRNYQRIERKKILRPSLEIKTLFSKQKWRDVTTSFHHFNINESYNSCSHKKKKTNQNQKNKIKFINIKFSFVSVLF